MRTIDISVQDLIQNRNIIFGDSKDIIVNSMNRNEMTKHEGQDLINFLGNPETKVFTLGFKLEECSASFVDSIERAGILNPIAMVDNRILDGHHRLAVAWSLGMNVKICEYECYGEFDDSHLWEKAGTITSEGTPIKESM